MKNKIKWSHDKPTEPGLYLCCDGDVETDDTVKPFRLISEETYQALEDVDFIVPGTFPCENYPASDVAQWRRCFKFAKLCFGGEEC